MSMNAKQPATDVCIKPVYYGPQSA